MSLLASKKRNREQLRDAVFKAIEDLKQLGAPVTLAAVCRKTGNQPSRSWLRAESDFKEARDARAAIDLECSPRASGVEPEHRRDTRKLSAAATEISNLQTTLAKRTAALDEEKSRSNEAISGQLQLLEELDACKREIEELKGMLAAADRNERQRD